jgi:hypothetical protein
LNDEAQGLQGHKRIGFLVTRTMTSDLLSEERMRVKRKILKLAGG